MGTIPKSIPSLIPITYLLKLINGKCANPSNYPEKFLLKKLLTNFVTLNSNQEKMSKLMKKLMLGCEEIVILLTTPLALVAWEIPMMIKRRLFLRKEKYWELKI